MSHGKGTSIFNSSEYKFAKLGILPGSTDLCIWGTCIWIQRNIWRRKLLDMAKVMLLAIKAKATRESSPILKDDCFRATFH